MDSCISTPADNDVICGGSRNVRRHPGNRRFDRIVKSSLEEYKSASKKQRSEIISRTIDEVKNKSENGGFLQKDPISKKYYVVPDHRVVRTYL
jgi:hypothetical protein